MAQTNSLMTTDKYLSLVFTSENDFCAKTNMWISHNYEFLRGMYYHIPNESATNDKTRLLLYAMGVLPGVPDFRFEQIFGNYPGGSNSFNSIVSGWYLELKMPGKKPSVKQNELHERWRCNGIRVVWTDNANDVLNFVSTLYGKPAY